jgi:hypothetical protein
MKSLAYILLISAIQPLIASGAETANARFWCLSLRFQQGTAPFGATLDLSTIAGSPNGELAPYNNTTYVSGFTLDSGFPINGTMFLGLPPVVDSNGNGFNDFFESAIGVSATTSGTYTAGPASGSITATWQRGAGSIVGSCSLHLVDSTFGDLGTFQHSFSLLEYTGAIHFTPGSTTVTGSLGLLQTADPTVQIQGPFQMTKVSNNRFNQLNLQPGTWTNSATQSLAYTNNLFRRDQPWTTNYYGLVEFADGDPNTSDPDYTFWLLSIDDPNDANQNGIPDFSDDPATIARAPQMLLTSTPTNILFSISGDVGHLHEIQQSDSLPGTNWQTTISLTLTNDPQTVLLPYPKQAPIFWRVRAH